MIYVTAILLSAALAGGTTPAPKAPLVVTVHAKDYAYAGPKTIKSGATTFRLVNDGKELHHMTLMKLAAGKTAADFMEAMKKPGPPPTWVSFVGGPNVSPPGGSSEATVQLEAGEYVMLCFIPSPGENGPHAMKGMVSPLTVLPEASGSVMPKGDVTVRLTDYKFAFSKPLTAGAHTITVVNDATQPHEFVLLKLNPGKRIEDFSNFVDKELMKGPPPGMPVGGLTAIDKGRSATVSVNLTPGTYGVICFAPDAKDGKGHDLHGMTTQFTVK
jgi:uncharacterized cupredoxin-like copper-binding protein